jgi:hypothetical protein
MCLLLSSDQLWNRVLGASSIKATQDVFQEVLDAALTGLYGIIGGALVWELIDFQKDKQTAIVRCYQAWALNSTPSLVHFLALCFDSDALICRTCE